MKKIILSTLVGAMCLIGSAASASQNDGAKLFRTCAGCHGVHAEKMAFGKSKVIANFTTKEIETALKGYQSGTYGGSLKGVMKNQVSRLNDEKIETLAKYIVTLKPKK